MPRNDLVYLGQILDTTRKAIRLVRGKSRADYDADETLRLALAHLVQIIGEASRRISPEFCQANPQISWKAMIGMRHKIVHDYMDVDEDLVWDTVTRELEPLMTELEKILPVDDSAT